MPGGEADGVVATHRVADHGHPRPAHGVGHADQITREVLGRVGGLGRPLAGPVAALVEREHVEPVGEGGHDPVEPVGVRRATVQEAERGAAGFAPFQGVERQPADLEGSGPGGFTGELDGLGHGPHCTEALTIVTNPRCHLADFVTGWTPAGSGRIEGRHVFSYLPGRGHGKRVADNSRAQNTIRADVSTPTGMT
jgi:hypothetical protein